MLSIHREVSNLGVDITKRCKRCDNELPLSEYYKAGRTYQSSCKPCHNAKRIEYHNNHYESRKKPIGFNALPDITKQKIMDMINNGYNCGEIERAFSDTNIKTLRAYNLRNWIKLGQLTKVNANSNIPAVL